MMLRKMCLSVWRISQTERGRARARAGGGKDQLGKSVVKCRCYRWATHTYTYILVTFLEDSKLTAMLMLGGYSVVDSEISGMLLCGCWGVSVRLPGCLESFLVRCYVAATEFWDTILKVIAHVCATDMIMHNLMLPTIKSRSHRACFAFHCAAFP